MVSHIHITVDDDVAQKAKQLKDTRNMSWPEFLKAATEEMNNE